MSYARSGLLFFWLSVVCLMPAALAAESLAMAPEPCELFAVPGGVVCVGAAEEVAFEYVHPSLFAEPRQYREGRNGGLPVGPVLYEGSYYYGVGSDLLRFDAEVRQIVGRLRFPAPILTLDTGDGALVVGLNGQVFHNGEPVPQLVEWTPGESAPAGAPWEWTATLSAFHDAMWLEEVSLLHEPGQTAAAPEVEPDVEEALIARIDELIARDTTNPYLHLYRAEALERLGQEEQARAAYEQAVGLAVHWLDRLRVGMRLEFRGHPQLAAPAFEGLSGAMEEAGVNGKNVVSQVNVLFGALWFRYAMERAVEREDLEMAARVMGVMASTFPNLEGHSLAKRRLGGLTMASVPALGEVPVVDGVYLEAAKSVDRFLTLQTALLLTLLLSGALLGLWRRRDDGQPLKGTPEWTKFLPRFARADLLVVTGLFAIVIALPPMLAGDVQTMVNLVEAPPQVSGDALNSPRAGHWLEELAESAAKEELLSMEQVPAPDYVALLVAAVAADAEARQIRSFRDVEMLRTTKSEFDWLAPLAHLDFERNELFLIFMVLSMNLVIFGGLIQIAARRFGQLQRVGELVVVGAPNTLGWLRLPVFALFVVGIFVASPLSRLAQNATEATLTSYYGLSGVEAPAMGGPATGLAMVGVALVIHAIGVGLTLRKRESDELPQA